jgi:hypothetical protein
VGAVAPLHITVEAEVMLPGVNAGRTINTYDPALCTKVVLHAPSFAQRVIVYVPGMVVKVPEGVKVDILPVSVPEDAPV